MTRLIEDAGFNPKREAIPTVDFVFGLINGIPKLSEDYKRGGEPPIIIRPNVTSEHTQYFHGKIFFYSNAFYNRGPVTKQIISNRNIFGLTSTLFHEFFHAYQKQNGFTDVLYDLRNNISYI